MCWLLLKVIVRVKYSNRHQSVLQWYEMEDVSLGDGLPPNYINLGWRKDSISYSQTPILHTGLCQVPAPLSQRPPATGNSELDRDGPGRPRAADSLQRSGLLVSEGSDELWSRLSCTFSFSWTKHPAPQHPLAAPLPPVPGGSPPLLGYSSQRVTAGLRSHHGRPGRKLPWKL